MKQIRNELKKINKMGITILLVEQNVKTALNLCERVYIMEKGVIVHEEKSLTLKDNKEVLNRYLGMNSF